MKNYLLFAGQTYNIDGGGDDFISAHETLAEAKAAWPGNLMLDWAHVFSIESGTVVARAWRDEEGWEQ
jgi:hypothetical protein